MTGSEVAIALGTGVVAGGMAGLLGVGGGILMVPVMVILLDQPQQVAAGTALLVMIPTTTIGVIAHGRRGTLEVRRSAILSAGGVVGVTVGALLSLAVLDERVLRRLFGVFLLLTTARMLASLRGKT